MDISNLTTMLANQTEHMMSTTTELLTSPAFEDDLTTTGVPENAPLFIMKQITGDIPEFELILPCIFGIFIILSLGLMVFYTKAPLDVSNKVKDIDKGEPDGKTANSWF